MKKIFFAILVSVGSLIFAQDSGSDIQEKLAFSVKDSGVESVETTDTINLYTRLAVDYIRSSKEKFQAGTVVLPAFSDFLVVNYSGEFGSKPQVSSIYIIRTSVMNKGVEETTYRIKAVFDEKEYTSPEGLLIKKVKGSVIRNDIVEYKTNVVKKEFPNLY